eukprot:m.156478 g.156478  ORF g.156478 m.156478 type:complete len:982 (+) comp30996_c0_seq5:407-3352(+)
MSKSKHIDVWAKGLTDYLLGTVQPVDPQREWVNGIHVVCGVVKFDVHMPRFNELKFHFIPFVDVENQGLNRFQDGSVTYVADTEGTVKVFTLNRNDVAKKKVQTITLDGWANHHVILLRIASNSSSLVISPPKLVVVSPKKSERIPLLSGNIRRDVINKRPSTPDVERETQRLKHEIDMLNVSNRDFIAGLRVTTAEADKYKKQAEMWRKRAEDTVIELEMEKTTVQSLTEQLAAAEASAKAAADTTTSHAKKVFDAASQIAEMEDKLEDATAAAEKNHEALIKAEAAHSVAIESLTKSMHVKITGLTNLLEATKASESEATKTDQEDIQKLEKKLEEQSHGLEMLEDEVANYKAQFSNVEHEHNDTIAKLTSELNTLKATNTEQTSQDPKGSGGNKDTEDQAVSALQDELEEHTRGFEVLEDEVANYKAQIGLIEQQHSDEIATFHTEHKAVEKALQVQIDEHHQSFANLEGELATYKAKFVEVENAHEDALKKLTEVVMKSEESHTKVEHEHEHAIEELTAAVKSSNAIKEQEQKLAALATKLETTEAEAAELRMKVEEKETATTSIENQLEETKQQLAAANAEKESTSSSSEEQSQKVSDLSAKLATTEAEAAELTTKLQEEHTAKAELETKLETVTAEAAKNAEYMPMWREKFEELKAVQAKLEEMESEKTQEETKALASKTELETKLAAATAEATKNAEDVALWREKFEQLKALEGELEQAQSEKAQLESNASSSTSELEAKLEEEKKQREAIEAEHHEMEELVQAMQDKSEKTDDEIENLKAEIEKMKTEAEEELQKSSASSAENTASLQSQVELLTIEKQKLEEDLNEKSKAEISTPATATAVLPLDDANLEANLVQLRGKVTEMESALSIDPAQAQERLSKLSEGDLANAEVDGALATILANLVQRIGAFETLEENHQTKRSDTPEAPATTNGNKHDEKEEEEEEDEEEPEDEDEPDVSEAEPNDDDEDEDFY